MSECGRHGRIAEPRDGRIRFTAFHVTEIGSP
jgi:hypothetical protein